MQRRVCVLEQGGLFYEDVTHCEGEAGQHVAAVNRVICGEQFATGRRQYTNAVIPIDNPNHLRAVIQVVAGFVQHELVALILGLNFDGQIGHM